MRLLCMSTSVTLCTRAHVLVPLYHHDSFRCSDLSGLSLIGHTSLLCLSDNRALICLSLEQGKNDNTRAEKAYTEGLEREPENALLQISLFRVCRSESVFVASAPQAKCMYYL